MSDFKNSRRDFLGKTWKLTVVGVPDWLRRLKAMFSGGDTG